MIDRLFKSGLVTTLCGLVIILSSVITWIFSDVDATDVVVIAGIGSGLLFLKDKNVGLGARD